MKKVSILAKSFLNSSLLFIIGVILSTFFIIPSENNLLYPLCFFLVGLIFIIIHFFIYRKIGRIILLYASFLWFGIAYTFLSHNALFSSSIISFAKNIDGTVSIKGEISREPSVINNNLIFVIKPLSIRTLTKENSILKGTNKQYARVVVDMPLSKFDKLPEFGERYEIDGNIRVLTKNEREYIVRFGLESNVVLSMDSIVKIKRIDNYSIWWREGVLFLKSQIIKIMQKNMKPVKVDFLSWLFFNNKKGTLSFLSSTMNISNTLYLFIKSKFYLWFTVVLVIILGGNLGVKRRLLYVLSIPVIATFAVVNNFSPEVLRVSVFIILFLLIASHYSMDVALYYTVIISLTLFVVFDPFIFTDKWLIYFVVMCMASVYGRKMINALFERYLNGWIFWTFCCSLCFISITGLFVFFWEYSILKNFLYLVVVSTMGIAFLLQRLYPWKGVEYKSFGKLFKRFFSWWVAIYITAIVPLSFYYVDPINIGGIIYNIPIIILLVIIMQMGFIGNIAGILMSDFSLSLYFLNYAKWYNIAVNELTKLFLISARLEVVSFPGKYILIYRNNVIILLLCFLTFVFLYFLYKRWIYVRNFFSKRVPFFLRIIRRLYVFGTVVIIVSIFVFFFSKKQSAAALNIFTGDTGINILFSTPSNKKVMITNVVKEYKMQEQQSFLNIWGNIDCLLKRGITSLDRLLVLNAFDNYKSLDFWSGVARFMSIKKMYFDADLSMMVEDELSFDDFKSVYNDTDWEIYNTIFDFCYKNINLDFNDVKKDSYLKQLKKAWLDVRSVSRKRLLCSMIEEFDTIYEENGEINFSIDVFNVKKVKLVRISYGLVLLYIALGDIDTYYLPQTDISRRLILNLHNNRQGQDYDFKIIIDAPVIEKVDRSIKTIDANANDLQLIINTVKVRIKQLRVKS